MSYECSICGNVVPPGIRMKRHVVKRPDGQIESEHSICNRCNTLLRDGLTINEVRKIIKEALGIATPLSAILYRQQQEEQTNEPTPQE